MDNKRVYLGRSVSLPAIVDSVVTPSSTMGRPSWSKEQQTSPDEKSDDGAGLVKARQECLHTSKPNLYTWRTRHRQHKMPDNMAAETSDRVSQTGVLCPGFPNSEDQNHTIDDGDQPLTLRDLVDSSTPDSSQPRPSYVDPGPPPWPIQPPRRSIWPHHTIDDGDQPLTLRDLVDSSTPDSPQPRPSYVNPGPPPWPIQPPRRSIWPHHTIDDGDQPLTLRDLVDSSTPDSPQPRPSYVNPAPPLWLIQPPRRSIWPPPGFELHGVRFQQALPFPTSIWSLAAQPPIPLAEPSSSTIRHRELEPEILQGVIPPMSIQKLQALVEDKDFSKFSFYSDSEDQEEEEETDSDKNVLRWLEGLPDLIPSRPNHFSYGI